MGRLQAALAEAQAALQARAQVTAATARPRRRSCLPSHAFPPPPHKEYAQLKASSAAAAADLEARLARCKEELVRVSDDFAAHLESCNVSTPAAAQGTAQLQEKLILLAKGASDEPAVSRLGCRSRHTH